MCVALPKSGKTSTVSKSRSAFFIWSQLGLVNPYYLNSQISQNVCWTVIKLLSLFEEIPRTYVLHPHKLLVHLKVFIRFLIIANGAIYLIHAIIWLREVLRRLNRRIEIVRRIIYIIKSQIGIP